MRSRFATIALTILLGLTISGCTEDEPIDVAAAQAQFCSDVEQYVSAIGNYGGLFEDVDLTVGDVKNAADELAPGREAVEESAATFQEAVTADTTPGLTVEIIQPESIDAVKDAEAAFAAASDIDDNTTVVEAGVNFTSAAYGLEVAWVRLFADAGCIEDEAQASQWVSDYVTALQTDLQAAGLYDGGIDGIYGPQTIAAVEKLQKDAGLPVTGLVDPATQAALAAALGQRQSAEIGALQGILISTGYYDGAVDGIWSRELEDALKALQTDLGVPATGVVDAATLSAFEKALNDAGEAPPTTATTEPGRGPATTVPAETTTTAAAAATTTVAAARHDNAPAVRGDPPGPRRRRPVHPTAGGDRRCWSHRDPVRTGPVHAICANRRRVRATCCSRCPPTPRPWLRSCSITWSTTTSAASTWPG